MYAHAKPRIPKAHHRISKKSIQRPALSSLLAFAAPLPVAEGDAEVDVDVVEVAPLAAPVGTALAGGFTPLTASAFAVAGEEASGSVQVMAGSLSWSVTALSCSSKHLLPAD